ncbi:MAG: hypothetical protein R3A50_04760 [Saprospiraceae bacterium]
MATTSSIPIFNYAFPIQYEQTEKSIPSEIKKLQSKVLSVLDDPKQLRKQFCDLMPELFDLRMEIVKSPRYKSISNQQPKIILESLSHSGYLESLVGVIEAALFSTKVYQRVSRQLSLAAENRAARIQPSEGKVNLPDYRGFLLTVGPLPNGDINISLVHNSLIYELGLFAVLGLMEGKRSLPPQESLDELASFISEAGQKFGAAAKQLGLMPKKSTGSITDAHYNPSEDEIKENQELAELGLSDFKKAFE